MFKWLMASTDSNLRLPYFKTTPIIHGDYTRYH